MPRIKGLFPGEMGLELEEEEVRPKGGGIMLQRETFRNGLEKRRRDDHRVYSTTTERRV